MGDAIYRPLIEDMTWSFSRVESYDSCKYKFFMRYIRGDKEIPMFYSSYGRFMHKLLEQFYNGEISKEDMRLKFLVDFKNEVTGDRPSPNVVSSYINAGLSYIDSFSPFPYKMIAVEKKLDFTICGMKFVGIIDYLGTDENGDLIIVDNKSRNLTQRSGKKKKTKNDAEIDEMLKQLYIYAEAVKQEYGKYPKYLCFNCFRNGEFIKEEFNAEKCRDAIEWVVKTVEDIKNADEFYPSVDYFKCCWLCGLHDDCCYWVER